MVSKKAVFNLLEAQKKYHKKVVKGKTLTFRIDEELGHPISVYVNISYNMRTNNITTNSSLQYWRQHITPTVYGKQNIDDPKFMEKQSKLFAINREYNKTYQIEYRKKNLEKHAKYHREIYKHKTLSFKIEKESKHFVYAIVLISYNTNSDNFTINSCLVHRGKHIYAGIRSNKR